jgi:hypothetical protein
MAYSATLIQGVPINERRGLAFLECPEDDRVTAREAYESLDDGLRRNLKSRFEYWLGGNHQDKYFHGWPNNPSRKECFAFKQKEGRVHHRLYGFLMNPRPQTDPGFQVCILVSHVRKTKEDTDPADLKSVNDIRGLLEVIEAVKALFPEIKEENRGAITPSRWSKPALDRGKR